MQNLDQATWSSLEDEKRSNFNGAKVQRSVCFILLTLSACGIPLPSHLAYPQDVTTSVDNELDNNSTSYKLVWSDEFDQEGRPNPENWNYENGFERNNELQWYQPKNAVCENGVLVITAKRERVKNSNFVASAKDWKKNRQYAAYTSACMTTRGLHSWTFGRIEVRARIDARDGLWPAIWTVGDLGPWPDCGEVDIMEFYQGRILANACWSSGKKWKPKWDSVKIPLSELGNVDWTSSFHTWRMDWDEQKIRVFLDDELLNTIEISQTYKINTQSSPFHKPHHLLLNLAVGGINGGDPADTEFPSTFLVDYVRVYQR